MSQWSRCHSMGFSKYFHPNLHFYIETRDNHIEHAVRRCYELSIAIDAKKTCQTKKKSEHFMVNHTVKQLKEYSSIRWHWKSNQWEKRCMDIYYAICILFVAVVECNTLKGTIESEKNSSSSSGGNKTKFANCVWNSLTLAVRFYRHTLSHTHTHTLNNGRSRKFKWCICMSVCWKPFEFGVSWQIKMYYIILYYMYTETNKTHIRTHTHTYDVCVQTLSSAKADRIVDKAQM